MGLVLIIGIVLPRLLGPQHLGKLNSYLALTSIVYSISFLGIRSSLVILLGQKRYDEQRVINAVFYIFLISTVLSTLLILGSLFIISNDKYSLLIVILICLINPLDFLNSYMAGYTLAKGQISQFNQLNWLPKILNLAVIFLLIYIFKFQVKGAILAMLIANLTTIIIVFRSLRIPIFKLESLKEQFPIIKSLIQLGILYAIAFFFTRLNYRIDILLLKRMCPISEVGYYSLGVNLAETIWQVPIAVGLVLMARSASEKDQQQMTRQLCSTLRVSMLIVFLAAVILYILTPFLITLIFGDKYLPSIPIVRTILPGIIFFVVLKILNSQFVGTGQPQLTIYALIPSLLINIILNYILIPKYKGVGAAMATNISYLSGSFLLLLVYSRTFSVRLTEIFRYQKSDFIFIRQLKRKLL